MKKVFLIGFKTNAWENKPMVIDNNQYGLTPLYDNGLEFSSFDEAKDFISKSRVYADLRKRFADIIEYVSIIERVVRYEEKNRVYI